MARNDKLLRLVAVLLFVGVLLAVVELSGLRGHFDLYSLHQCIEENRVTGLLLFILLFALGNLAHVPGWIFLAAAVLALGQSAGGLVTYLAASFSCICTFLLIRLIGGDALRQLDNHVAQRMLARLDASPVRNIILLRILFQTLPALNYALALSGVRFRHYLLGTLLGLPLPIVVYCVFFEQIAHLTHLH